jgi:hypothetical protein
VKKRRRSQSPPLASAVVGPCETGRIISGPEYEQQDTLRMAVLGHYPGTRASILPFMWRDRSKPQNRGFFPAPSAGVGHVWTSATVKSRSCISSTAASNERACICLPWLRFLPCSCKTESSRSCRHCAHRPKQQRTMFQAWQQAAAGGKRRVSPPFEAPMRHPTGQRFDDYRSRRKSGSWRSLDPNPAQAYPRHEV